MVPPTMLLAALLGCAARKAPTTDFREVTAVAVQDRKALVAWLETTRGTRVQLPVEVNFGPRGITRAVVGQTTIHLDDSALGIALNDRLRTVCDNSPCFVWLEGTWGALLNGDQDRTFAVRDLGGLAQPDAAHPRVAE